MKTEQEYTNLRDKIAGEILIASVSTRHRIFDEKHSVTSSMPPATTLRIADEFISELKRRDPEESPAPVSGELPTEEEIAEFAAPYEGYEFRIGYRTGGVRVRSLAEPIISELKKENERLKEELSKKQEPTLWLIWNPDGSVYARTHSAVRAFELKKIGLVVCSYVEVK